MNLGVSYSFFNGYEHLISSIKSIRNSVEYINIVYQKKSWDLKHKIHQNDIDTLNFIKKTGLVEKIIYFKPKKSLTNFENELKKRSIGYNDILKKGLNYFFTIDADEFYRESELNHAKQIIINNNITSSSVNSFMHLKSPRYRCLDTTNASFITKIDNNFNFSNRNYYIENVDPTRRFSNTQGNHFHFFPSVIAMYNMNLVRDDLNNKFQSSPNQDSEFLNDLNNEIQNWKMGNSFYFPKKGVFNFELVKNEFGTWDKL
jgi:hypothetical protein